MLDLYETLFSTYGNAALKDMESGFNERKIYLDMENLSLDTRTKDILADLFCDYYYRWSADAFALGIHLILSVLGDNIRCFGPEKRQ